MRKNDPVQVFHGRQFLQALLKLSQQDQRTTIDALNKFERAPDAKGRNLEKLHGTKNLYTIRVNDGNRILLHRHAKVYLAVDTDSHDALYNRHARRAGDAPPVNLEGLSEAGADASSRLQDTGPPPLIGVTDDELRRAGASDAIIGQLRQATSLDRVHDIVSNNANHLRDIVWGTASREGLELEALVAEAKEKKALQQQVQSLRDQEKHDKQHGAYTERMLEVALQDNEQLDTELKQLRQAAATPEQKARVVELQVQLEASNSDITDLKQQTRDAKRATESLDRLLRETQTNLDRSERLRADPDLEWHDDYPESFADVPDFMHTRLQDERPPFHTHETPQPEAIGSFGEIYRTIGRGPGSPRRAVKLPRRDHPDGDQLKRAWLSEERVARDLKGRNLDGIVRVEHVAPSDRPGFIVYEWIDGKTLKDQIARGPLKVAVAIDLIVELTMTLQSLTEREIWFSDLHAGNVMVRDGKPILIDPAACVPVHAAPPEWRSSSGKLPHEIGNAGDFERGQTFMLAHLFLQCISQPDERNSLAGIHTADASNENLSSLACLMQVQDPDDVEQRCLASMTDRVWRACERSGEHLAPKPIVDLIRWSLDDRSGRRPQLKDFARNLKRAK